MELQVAPTRSLSERVEDLERELAELRELDPTGIATRLAALERNAGMWGHRVPTLVPAPDPSMNCVSCGGPLTGKWISDDRQCTTCVDLNIKVPATPTAPRPDYDPGKEPR